MKLVNVIPLKKGVLKGDLTYFTTKEVASGNIVTIPFRNSNILGLVTSVKDVEDAKADIKDMDFGIRKILEVKENSLFRPEYIESVFEISKYFVAAKDNTIASLIPSIMREEYDAIAKLNKNKNLTSPIKVEQDSPTIKTEKLLFQASPEDRISAYKTLIRESFAQKKSIFIVLPNEHDIRKLYDALGKGVEQFTFPIHGRMNKKKLLESIENIMTTEHGILILGTPAFLSIPRNDIGIIIVEHESSTGYKMVERPHLDSRNLAELYAAKIGARLILSDTLLRFETIVRAENDGLNPLYPLSYRTNFEGEIVVENPRPKREHPTELKIKFRIFSEKTLEEIAQHISKGKSVFIFSLRKGLATMTVCQDCGEMLRCDKCGSPLVLYISKDSNNEERRIFACNRCEREIDGDVNCKNCRSWNLIPLGIGTDTVIEELKKYFPEVKMLKLDKEVAKTSKGATEIVADFENNPGSILVGTEMALFYLNTPVALSIVASFDSLWSIPNFKMSEKILDLMISILRLTTKKFIIQTKNESDGAIQSIKNGNLLPFVREELNDRKGLGYPPYKRFIKVSHLGEKDETLKMRELLKENFQSYETEIFSGFVGKQSGKYITNMLIKINPKEWSLPQMSINGSIDEKLFNKLNNLPKSCTVLVDPEDLL